MPLRGVTLSASELTVPAGADAQVDVVLDPKRRQHGRLAQA